MAMNTFFQLWCLLNLDYNDVGVPLWCREFENFFCRVENVDGDAPTNGGFAVPRAPAPKAKLNAPQASGSRGSHGSLNEFERSNSNPDIGTVRKISNSSNPELSGRRGSGHSDRY